MVGTPLSPWTEETFDAAPADPLGIALFVRLGRLEIGMLARFVASRYRGWLHVGIPGVDRTVIGVARQNDCGLRGGLA